MGASKNSAKTVGVVPSVSMESARVLAKIAVEVPCVVMPGSSKRALFAVRNVRMAKKRASVKFA
jgi:hypothetical protein